MADSIKHLGIVESMNGSHLEVKIVQSSACSSCSVKGHCSVSDTKEKIIEVFNILNLPCKIGDRIMLAGRTSMGMKAVLLAFVVPFCVLMLALVLSLTFMGEDNELFAAVVALCSLVPYYVILYLCRGKLKRSFTFYVESIL